MSRVPNEMRLLAIVGILTFGSGSALPVTAQDVDGDGQVAVLIPVVANGVQGAYGTTWRTETWFYNASSIFIRLIPKFFCGNPFCPQPYEPGFFGNLGLQSAGSIAGKILYVPARADLDMREVSHQFHFTTRLYEESRRSQAIGVEIPAIREAEFLDAPTALLTIPTGPAIRSTLRVYDRKRLPGSEVLAEFLDGDGTVIASRRLSVDHTPGFDDEDISDEFPRHPGFDWISDITGEFPLLMEEESFNIRLTPSSEDMSYWGFVSITDNTSQHVLLVTPQ